MMKLQRSKPSTTEAGPGEHRVTPTQRDLFLAHERAPGSTTYSLGMAMTLPQQVDVPLWRRSLEQVVGSEPALRFRFGMAGGAVVGRAGENRIGALTELTGLEEIPGHVKVPYDLGRGPLVRPALV